MLASGQADLGICRARNRSVGNEMEWRALGRSKWILRRNGAFAEVASPVSLLDLWFHRWLCMPRQTSRLPVACKFQGTRFH